MNKRNYREYIHMTNEQRKYVPILNGEMVRGNVRTGRYEEINTAGGTAQC
jgi:hypothetical protein